MVKEEYLSLLAYNKSVKGYILLRNALEYDNDMECEIVILLVSKLIIEYLDELPLFELIDILYIARSKIPYVYWDSLNRLCFLR